MNVKEKPLWENAQDVKKVKFSCNKFLAIPSTEYKKHTEEGSCIPAKP